MTKGLDTFPLSFAQQRLWFLDQLQPGSTLYNISAVMPLPRPLQVVALEQSLNEIVRRHEALRTTFAAVNGQPAQIVAPAQAVPLPIMHFPESRETERDQEVAWAMAEEANRPFDLARGPLLRTTLLRCGDTDQMLLVTMHHIVSDGWSMGVFFRELSVLYTAFAAGRPSPLRELPIQYPDFACWQRERLQGAVLEAHLSYWRRQLAEAPTTLNLPTDRPRPPVQSFRGAMYPVALPRALSEALKALSQREGVTLFMVLLAGFKALLHRYSGQEDLVVGIPIANRTRPELEELIGFFVNTLVIRTDLSGNPQFLELVQRVRDVTLDAHEFQDLPFEKLVEELQPERSLSHNPLFTVMFVLQNTPTSAPVGSGRAPEPERAPVDPPHVASGTAKFDLTLSLTETPHGLIGTLEYNTDLFDSDTIARLARHLHILLQGIAANPERRLSDLPLLAPEERREVLVEWNPITIDYLRDRCAHQLFEDQVEQAPDAPAIKSPHAQLTYDQLNRRANRVAHILRGLGVGPEMLVGAFLERSVEAVVGLLGILKAGGAYVPLDTAYPQDRLAFMLQDARPPVLVTLRHLAGRLPQLGAQVVCLDDYLEALAPECDDNPDSGVGSANLAYVIYTSGSTGTPKGVLVEHKGLYNVIQAQIRTWDVQPNSRVLQFASLSFDAAISEIFMALAAGAMLCLGPRESLLPGPALLQVLREQEITIATLPPSALAALPLDPLTTLKTLVVAGEACTADLVGRWAAGRRLYNAYGPTEATIWATGTECSDTSRPPPIGRPIGNMQAYLLDDHLQPVPVGVPGELHLAGVGLARGYLNRPELTAEKFVANPFSAVAGARLYKTGDLARYRADGMIEFLGRIDNQVKIRGFRIELGEIESTLVRHPDIADAVVTVWEAIPGDPRLVAYVVPNLGHNATVGGLRRHLQDRLPDFMVPSTFVFLAELPHMSNHKVDRRALPTPLGLRPELEGQYAAPRTETERAIAAAWEEALQVDKVGMHDNFFDLGGHSLLLVRVHDALQNSLSLKIPLIELFRYPTVSSLASYLSQVRGEPSSLEHVQVRAMRQRNALSRRQEIMNAQRRTR